MFAHSVRLGGDVRGGGGGIGISHETGTTGYKIYVKVSAFEGKQPSHYTGSM